MVQSGLLLPRRYLTGSPSSRLSCFTILFSPSSHFQWAALNQWLRKTQSSKNAECFWCNFGSKISLQPGRNFLGTICNLRLSLHNPPALPIFFTGLSYSVSFPISSFPNISLAPNSLLTSSSQTTWSTALSDSTPACLRSFVLTTFLPVKIIYIL